MPRKYSLGATPTPKGFYLDSILSGESLLFPFATKCHPVVLVGHDSINHRLWYDGNKMFMDGIEIKIPIQSGGNKNQSYVIPIRLFTKKKCSKIIGTINIPPESGFQCILNRINKLLTTNHMPPVSDFHYIQEDGDIAYVNKKIVDDTDLYYSLQFDTEFYINYPES